LAVDDDVDDHAASARVRADIIDSSRLVEGENGFEDKGQRRSESFEAALTGELLDGIFREQESESDEVVEELSRLIASWDPLGEHCSSFCMAEIQTPEFHDGIWMDIWMEMYFL